MLYAKYLWLSEIRDVRIIKDILKILSNNTYISISLAYIIDIVLYH